MHGRQTVRWTLAACLLAVAGAAGRAAAAAAVPPGNKPPACLVLMHAAVQGEPAATPPMRHFALPDPKLRARLEKLGFTVAVAPYAPALTMDFLKQFNVIVIPHPYLPGSEPSLDDVVAAKKALLLDYVQAGGGLLVLRTQGWQFGRDIDELNRWLAPLDIEILSEQVVDDEYQVKLRSGFKLSWTDNLQPHPVTEGVKGLFYTTYYHEYSDSTSPLRAGKDWAVPVRGRATTQSLKTVKTGHAPLPSTGAFAAEPPLLAVRDYGQGRVAVWPVNSTLVWQDGYHALWGNGLAMEGLSSGMRGDAARLIENVLTWLAAPSRGAFGGYGPPTEDEAPPEAGFVRIDWDRNHVTGVLMTNSFVGLIGAKSALSSGQGEPEAFIQAARGAGYDFIAFAEDLDRLTEETFSHLQAVCRAASSNRFKAYPGFSYRDESGNAWLSFSDRLRWPERAWWSTQHVGRLQVNNTLSRGCEWPPVVMVKAHGNPEKPAFQGNFKAISLFTYEGGKLADDSLDVYLRLQKMRYQLCPVSVHFVTSPEAVRAARATGFQTFVRWFDDNIVEALSDSIGRYKSQYVFFRSCFVSEGPIIEDGRILNFATSDMAIPTNDRFRLHVRASSSAGLREVALLDGEAPRPWRRYLPGGTNAFELAMDHFHDREYNLILRVTDVHGRRAYGWNLWTGVQENSFPRCSDNINTMPRGKWWGQPETLQNARGIENYLAVRNLEYIGLPRIEGLAETARPAVEFYPVLVSRFGSIIDCRIDDHYPVTAPGNPDRTDMAELAVPNETIGGKVRHTLFTPWQDGPLPVLVEGDFTVKRDATVKRLQVMGFQGRLGADSVCATRQGGSGFAGRFSEKVTSFAGELQRNGFAAAFPDAFRGGVGILALQEGLRYLAFTGGGEWCNFRGLLGPEERELKAGERLTYRYLGVSGPLDGPPDNRFMTDIADTMGLAGAPTYRVTPRVGAVLATDFALRLRAQGGGFAGTIAEARLPVNLPVWIEGLNPAWHAGLWYKGTNRLLLAEWVVNDMNQRWTVRRPRTVVDEMHHFPVLDDGTGMLQVNMDLGDKDVYIGNLLVSDCAEVALTLVDWRPGRAAFVVHNPTDQSLACTVRPGPGFTLLGEFQKSVTLPAGCSAQVAIGETTP